MKRRACTASFFKTMRCRGFENGAFLIRAVGTKTGGGNQPPIARALASTAQAKFFITHFQTQLGFRRPTLDVV
jgi:hypothetical protein